VPGRDPTAEATGHHGPGARRAAAAGGGGGAPGSGDPFVAVGTFGLTIVYKLLQG